MGWLRHRYHGLAVEQRASELAHFQNALVGHLGLGGEGFFGGLGAGGRAQAGGNINLYRGARPHILHEGKGDHLVRFGRVDFYGYGLAILGHAQAGFHIGGPHGVVEHEVGP